MGLVFLAALAATVSGDAGRSGPDVTRRVLGVARDPIRAGLSVCPDKRYYIKARQEIAALRDFNQANVAVGSMASETNCAGR